MKQIVGITGASGFIGRRLSKFFADKNFLVRSLSRTSPKFNFDFEHIDYDLSKPPPQNALQGVEALIHLAYTSGDANVSGSKAIFDSARNANIKKIIFVSSMSAANNSLSSYGQTKFIIENLLDSDIDLIVRPGLVLGHGGLFGRMSEFIQKNSIIPVLGGGQQPVQTIHIDDLARAIYELFSTKKSGLFQIAEPSSHKLIELYKAVAKHIDKKRIFLPVPVAPIETLVSFCELLKISLPISKANLSGLKQLGRSPSAPVPQINFKLRSLDESLFDLFNDQNVMKRKK